MLRFLPWYNSHSRPGAPYYRGFTIAPRDTTLCRTPLDEWPDRQGRLPDNTKHRQETDIHGPDGIRTDNCSRRAAADPRLRPRGHRDRPGATEVHYSYVKLYDTNSRTNRYRSLHGRLRNCASIPCRDRLISILHIFKRGSGPPSYSGVTGGTFFGEKGAGASSWPFLHLVPNLRMCGATPPLPICLHGMMLSQRNDFTFLLYDIDHCYVVVRIFVVVTLKVETL